MITTVATRYRPELLGLARDDDSGRDSRLPREVRGHAAERLLQRSPLQGLRSERPHHPTAISFGRLTRAAAVTAVAAVVGDLLVYFVGGLWEVPAEYAALFNPALGAST